VVVERFDEKTAAASSSSSSSGGRGRFVFVATAAGRFPSPPSSEEMNAADLAHRAEGDALSNEAWLQLRREMVEAHGRRLGRLPALAALMTIRLKVSDKNLALLRQDKAKETLRHRLLEEALAARDQALLDALLDAAAKEKENGGERGKKEGGEEGKGAEGEEP
jgi:hypothetical protein